MNQRTFSNTSLILIGYKIKRITFPARYVKRILAKHEKN